MTVNSETVVVKVSDGSEMMLFIARPDAVNSRCLLLFQEAYGVNAHIRDVAMRLASEGYLVVAPELFHRSVAPGFEGEYENFAAVAPYIEQLTPDRIRADIQAAYEWVTQDSQCDKTKIGCIGFCLGGRVSYIANSFLPLKAAISFYGGGIAPKLLDLAEQQQAPILFFWGGLDNHIPSEQRSAIVDAMTKSGKPFVNVEFSFASHAFFCDARTAYNPAAAKQAWALALAFLENYLQ